MVPLLPLCNPVSSDLLMLDEVDYVCQWRMSGKAQNLEHLWETATRCPQKRQKGPTLQDKEFCGKSPDDSAKHFPHLS